MVLAGLAFMVDYLCWDQNYPRVMATLTRLDRGVWSPDKTPIEARTFKSVEQSHNLALNPKYFFGRPKS